MSKSYEKLLDLPSHLVCLIGQDGCFHHTNMAQKHILGWEPDFLIGKPVGDFVHPDDAARTFTEVGKLFADGGVVTDFRNRCTHKEGGYRWISWSGSNHDGFIYCIGTDVTAHVEAEKSAQASEKQLALFLEELPMITWVMNADGSGLYYNKAWYSYTGLPPGHISREAAYKTPHPDDLEKTMKRLREAMAQGRPYEDRIRLRRHDGAYRWHLSRSIPLRDHHGQIIKWVGTSTDIHEQVSAREKLNSLFMQAPACITINSGPEHVYEFSNEANNKLLGREDLVGKSIREVFGAGDLMQLKPLFDSVYQTGKPVILPEVPVNMSWGDGKTETRYFSSVVQAVRDGDGHVDGIMTFAVDVTSQVLARTSLELSKQRAETASRAKTEFLANMSHEIRTPLTAVVGFSELALELEDLPRQAKEYLERIQSNGRQLVNTVGDILDLSKAEATGVDVVVSKIHLRSFLNDVFQSLSSLAQKKRLKFDYEIEAQVPEVIHTDLTLLRQILQNLLSNAIKFTSLGFVKLRVFSDGGPAVLMEVKDSGVGMSPEHMNKLFQPFSQGNTQTSRLFGGTGLGLVLSRKLAKALGGDIRITASEVGKGSTFLLSLRDLIGRYSETPAENFAPIQRPLSKLRILLVEDIKDNQLLISKVLEKAGATVAIAENGREGLSKCSQNPFDVILMDIQMPIMDGYAATKAIRSQGFKNKIIALTAHATMDERERALAFGFDDYLTKPIRREILLSTIQAAVKSM